MKVDNVYNLKGNKSFNISQRNSSILAMLFLIFMAQEYTAQTTFSWRNDQNPTSGQWNVTNYWWNGSAAALPGGGEILFLDGTVGQNSVV